MRGFCLSSDVAEAPITAEMGAALLCQLRRLEKWWPSSLYPRVTSGPAEFLWSAQVGVAPMAEGIYSSIKVIASLPDAPQDVAYHTVDARGSPLSLISWAAVQAEGGSLTGPNGLLSAISHEMAETTIDSTCLRTVLLPDGKNRTPLEVCDFLQGTDYEELPGHFVANAAGPAFFVPESTGLLDIASDLGRGVVTFSFEETPSGYHEIIAPDGTVSQFFGDLMPAIVRARLERTGPRGGMVRAARAAAARPMA